MSSEETGTRGTSFSSTSTGNKTSNLNLKAIHLDGAGELMSDSQQSDTILLSSDSERCTEKHDLSPPIRSSRGLLFKRNKTCSDTLKFPGASLLDVSKTSENVDAAMDEADLGSMDLIDTTIVESTPTKLCHVNRPRKTKTVREKFKKRLVFNGLNTSSSTLKTDVIVNKL